MWETLIVIAAVAVAGFVAARVLIRRLSGRERCSGCDKRHICESRKRDE